MAPYALFAITAALLMSVYAVLTKVILRYRLCSAAYVAFATGLASALLAAAGLAISQPGLPKAALPSIIIATLTGFGAIYAVARAMQEGDPSTVVPVMGLKIPLVAVLSIFILAETHPWQIYLAALLASAGVIMFGIGPQQKAQGGHGYHPVIGVLWAVAAAALYALSDIYVKRSLTWLTPISAAMWCYSLTGLLCLFALFQPTFRQYRVTRLDMLLFLANGICLLLAVMAFFTSIAKAGQVTTPNIVFATRGFITLVAGYALGKALKTTIERQPGVIYILRIIGTLTLFAAILIAH